MLQRWTLGRRTTAGYALVAVAVLATGVAGFLQVREARQSGDLARRTQRVLNQIARLEVSLTQAETGKRGYLLTGDQAYLEPWEKGSVAVPETLRALRRRLAGRADQLSRLEEIEPLAAAKLKELADTIEIRRRRGLEAALVILRTNTGKHTMDRIRVVLDEMRVGERAELDGQLRLRTQRFRTAGGVVIGGSLLALCLVLLATLAVNRNVRERRVAEGSLRESEERLRVTLRSIGDAVIATDTQGRIVFVNPVAEQLTGWSQAAAAGRPCEEVFRIVNEETRATVESPVAKVLREGVIVGLANHTVLLARDGSEIPVDDSGAPIRDKGGEIMGVVLVFRDVRERKRAEVERQQLFREETLRRNAEAANRTKDEFLAVLSHELRSPLQGILGWLTVLRDGSSDAERRQRALTAIERGVRQQGRLVNDLLDASRIVAGKLQVELARVDLAPLIENCVDRFLPDAREKGIELAVEIEDCGAVLGDAHRLEQAVANVVANAVKFTPAKGRIDVRCHRAEGDVVVTVRDTGEGISPEFLPMLFDRFSQAAESRARSIIGLGLGLAIARQIVELHGGTIEAASAGLGRGATFTLRMPLAPAEDADACAPVGPRADQGTPLDGVALLLVDDDADTRESLGLLLSFHGAAVRSAASVTEALALCASEPPRVIISDLSMPEQNGYDLIAALRTSERGRRMIALALTGFASEDDRIRAGQAGFDGHVAKPVDVDTLVSTIRSLLEQAERRRLTT